MLDLGKIQVSFAVDGVLLLAALSIVKALLEVSSLYQFLLIYS